MADAKLFQYCADERFLPTHFLVLRKRLAPQQALPS
jgi:hypothetical protein